MCGLWGGGSEAGVVSNTFPFYLSFICFPSKLIFPSSFSTPLTDIPHLPLVYHRHQLAEAWYTSDLNLSRCIPSINEGQQQLSAARSKFDHSTAPLTESRCGPDRRNRKERGIRRLIRTRSRWNPSIKAAWWRKEEERPRARSFSPTPKAKMEGKGGFPVPQSLAGGMEEERRGSSLTTLWKNSSTATRRELCGGGGGGGDRNR